MGCAPYAESALGLRFRVLMNHVEDFTMVNVRKDTIFK